MNTRTLQSRFGAEFAILLFGLLLQLMIWGGLDYKLQAERQLERDNAVEATANYTRAFAEHTVRTVKGMDQIALFLKHKAEKEGLKIDIPQLVRDGLFAGQPFVQLGVANEKGISVISSVVPFVSVNISDLEHFQVHRDIDSKQVFVSKPIVGRTSGRASIQLTRRINKPDGTFGGVVVVSINPDYFAEFYKQVDLGKDSMIALVGTDGIVRVLKNNNEVFVGLDFRQSRILTELSKGKAGTFTIPSRVDGVTRIYSYRALAEYPLVVAVGVSETEYFAALNQRIVTYYWFCGIASAGSFLFILLLLRGLARRKKAEMNLREANETLEERVEQRTQDLTAANEELTAQNEEISAMNEEITALNNNLFQMNELLEQRVAERTAELTGAHQELTAQYEELQSTQEALRRDAQLATKVQKALLTLPEPSEHLILSTWSIPLGYVGSDLYFLDWRYEGTLLRGFLIDASGHGLGTSLHTMALHVLLREVNECDLPLSEAMRWLNRRASEYIDEGTVIGALAFEVDLEVRQLRWVCAGLDEIRVATKEINGVIARSGSFLGAGPDESFAAESISFDVGDSFYFMTQDLSDRLIARGEDLLQQFAETVGLLKLLSTDNRRSDDATAVCIHVRSLPHSKVRQSGWPRAIRFNGFGDYQRFRGEVARILAEVTGLSHSVQEVAVNEALANAMECRDGVARQHRARIRFNKVGNRLIVRVKTSRIGFAGNAILRRLRSRPEDMFSFGEDASMGRGIPMMLAMSDKMTYNSEGTELLLAWKLGRDEVRTV